MTNYLGEDDDLDDFLELEKRITAEDPNAVRQFAQMMKTKSPDIFARPNPADAFGDLDLGSCTNLEPASPSPPPKAAPPKQTENNMQNQYDLAQKKLEERRRAVERAQQKQQEDEPPKSATREQPDRVVLQRANASAEDREPSESSQLDGAAFQNPKLGQLKEKYSQVAGRGYGDASAGASKIRQPSAAAVPQPASGNVVRVPAEIAGIIKPTLQRNQQQAKAQEEAEQLQTDYAQKQSEVDQQLKALEQEAVKYKQKQAEIDRFESDLRLDFKAKLAEFEREKAEFKNWQKQQLQEIKSQKQILEDARKARLEKQQSQKQAMDEAEKLREENRSLTAQKANQAKLHKQQMEQLRKQLEDEVQSNEELKQRLAEQDGLVVQLRKVGQQDQREIGALQKEVETLKGLLDEANERMQAQERSLRVTQQAQLQMQQERQQNVPKAPAGVQQPLVPAQGSQQQPQQIRPDAKQDAVKRLLQQMQDSEQKQRTQVVKPVEKVVEKPVETRQQTGAGNQWPSRIQHEFSGLPFLAPEQLFERFDDDIDEFVNSQEQIKYEEKVDRTEERYKSGARVIRFSNKTTKIVLPTNVTNIRFDNGDLKRVTPDGVVVYFYNDVGTLFTQMQEAGQTVKVYRFHNGQLEKHFESGKKIVYYPDGTIKFVYEDGREEAIFPDSQPGAF